MQTSFFVPYVPIAANSDYAECNTTVNLVLIEANSIEQANKTAMDMSPIYFETPQTAGIPKAWEPATEKTKVFNSAQFCVEQAVQWWMHHVLSHHMNLNIESDHDYFCKVWYLDGRVEELRFGASRLVYNLQRVAN